MKSNLLEIEFWCFANQPSIYDILPACPVPTHSAHILSNNICASCLIIWCPSGPQHSSVFLFSILFVSSCQVFSVLLSSMLLSNTLVCPPVQYSILVLSNMYSTILLLHRYFSDPQTIILLFTYLQSAHSGISSQIVGISCRLCLFDKFTFSSFNPSYQIF